MNKLMKTTKLVLTLLLIHLGVTNCSQQADTDSLLQHVPLDAQYVALAKIDNILLQAGCEPETDGSFKMTDNLRDLLENSDVATQTLMSIVTQNAGYIKDKEVIWYFPAGENNEPILSFLVTEMKEFEQRIGMLSTASSPIGDYTMYAFPECNVLIKSNQCWISRSTSTIIDTEEAAKRSHMDHFNPAEQYLQQGNDLIMMLNIQENQKQVSDAKHLIIQIDFKTNGIYSESLVLDSEGKRTKFSEKIGMLDTNYLRFLPNNTNMLLAFGEVKDWGKFFETLGQKVSEFAGYEYGMIVEIAKDYLSTIKGSTVIAGAASAGSQALRGFNPDAWELLFMTRMSKEKTEEIVSSIEIYAPLLGLNVKKKDENKWNCTYNGMEFNYGIQDGDIYFCNYDLELAGNTDIAPDYENKRAVLICNIPNGSELMKAYELPWGVSLNASMQDDDIKMNLKLPGAKGPVLKELISFATNR